LLFGERLDAKGEFTALVMTSGNISDEPIVIANPEARQRLSTVADCFLFHNREIHMRVDDSLSRVIDGCPRVLRRSRGYAPRTIDLGSPLCELLACGGELKNTFCLTKDRYAIVSQHIGDVDNYETLVFFEETLANLKNLFRVQPKAVAYDLHPHYLTTRFADNLGLPKVGVQHHHAHIVSCMAENGMNGKVIGVAMDGTGYGTDGQIWGGEFLIADAGRFERRAHLRYVPLPGGDTAVREPWRSALSWLRESLGAELPTDLPFFGQIPERNVTLISRMMDRGVNTVRTSSCGRLFDAVAAMIGLRQEVSFEGQAAIELEMATRPGVDDRYSFEIDSGEPAQVDLRPTIREIVRDVRRLDMRTREAKAIVSTRFHNTMVAAIAEVCRRIRHSERLNRVCLSGGTFQNKYLAERAAALLRKLNFEVLLHSRVPPNDGGIALGQAVIANHIVNSGA
jgi:hydrogenase maturation protein HypF